MYFPVMNDKSDSTRKRDLNHIFRLQFRKYFRYSKKWFPFAVIIGLISGILMGFFTSFVVKMQLLSDYLPLFVRYPLIGIVNALFIFWGFKEVQGAGISFILTHKNTGKDIPPRTLITKFVSSSVTLGFNAPAGREGPAVTLGSSMAALIGKKIKMTTEDISHTLTIGAAACTAAVFRTPLGGTVFAAEVPYKHDLDETVFLPALVASAISLIVSDYLLKLLNTSPTYLEIKITRETLTLIFALHCLFIGLVAGLVGIGFSLLFKLSKRYLEKKIRIWILPIVGMILSMAVIGIAYLIVPEGVSLEGTGFHMINYIATNFTTLGTGILLIILVGKIIATSFSVGLLNSGGVMGPSLVSGAALGALYANLFPSVDHIAMIIVGMAAMHTATTKTPIASMLLVLEMTSFSNLVIPIILANSMAFIISMDFSLYRGQVQSKEVILRKKIKHTDILETTTVEEAMLTEFPVLYENDTLEEISEKLQTWGLSAIPVISAKDKQLIGIVAKVDVLEGFRKNKQKAKDVMKREVVAAYPDEPLNIVFDRLLDYAIEVLPVLSSKESMQIIGLISFKEIEQSYERKVMQLHMEQTVSEEELNEL